jgi:hypothetical protein
VADYATIEQLKAFIRMNADDATDDELLTLVLAAATEAIDVWCNTSFPRPAVEEVVADEDNGIYWSPALPADDAVPDGVVLACLLQASRWYKRRDAPFGIAGSDLMGAAMRLAAKVDPDVAVLLSTYRRHWGAV